MTTTQEPVIQALEVHKAFGELDILKGVSLEVRRGEVVVLIGASGSGKTTFIRCLNHLEDIQGGTIRVNGELMGFRERPDGSRVRDSERNIARRRRDIGMVFQRFNLFPHMTVLETSSRRPSRCSAWRAPPPWSRPAPCSPGCDCPTRPTTIRRNSPAASSSAWPSPAPWP